MKVIQTVQVQLGESLNFRSYSDLLCSDCGSFDKIKPDFRLTKVHKSPSTTSNAHLHRCQCGHRVPRQEEQALRAAGRPADLPGLPGTARGTGRHREAPGGTRRHQEAEPDTGNAAFETGAKSALHKPGSSASYSRLSHTNLGAAGAPAGASVQVTY